MIPQPIRPTVLPVSSSGLNARSSQGTEWNGGFRSMMSWNCSPALRRPTSISASAHSATPYEEPLVVSTVRMPRCHAASTSIRLANLSPSSSPMNRRFGQASMISPVTRGDPIDYDQRVRIADELDQPLVRFGIGRRRLDVIRRTVEFAIAELGDLPEPVELGVADDRGPDLGLAGKDDGGSSVGHRASPSKAGMRSPAASRRPRAMSMSIWVAATSPLSNSSSVTARPRRPDS